MGSVLLCRDNFLSPDIVSNSFVSSEQTAFPVSNIYNAQRRSKVWRSNGFWDITDSNKTIIFRETIGVDLTVTLTVDEYNSDTTFFAELKTQMEAVGASTYTISRDTTTNKIKISSNGVGGGGIFQIIWTSCGALASTLGFLTTENDIGALLYIADALNIGTSEWIKWDMGISTNPTAFILIGARNKPIAITPSATLKIQGNETDIWTNPSYEETLTYNDSAIAVFSDDGLHSEPLRYWRLSIEDINNPQGFVEIGSLFLGDYLNPTRGAAQFPFKASYVDKSQTIFSEGGQTFSDIREKSEEFSIDWFGLTTIEKEDIDQFFDSFGMSIPFFVIFDKDAVFSSNFNYYIRYCKFSNEPTYNLKAPNVYECTMNLREEL